MSKKTQRRQATFKHPVYKPKKPVTNWRTDLEALVKEFPALEITPNGLWMLDEAKPVPDKVWELGSLPIPTHFGLSQVAKFAPIANKLAYMEKYLRANDEEE